MDNNVYKIFNIVESTDLESLRQQALHENDKRKQSLLIAAYEYQLGKRQDKVINRKEFII